MPKELDGSTLRPRYLATLDRMFETYARWFEPMQEHFRARFPKDAGDSEAVYRSAIRAKALDTLSGLLPAAVQSNLGLYGTGQAYEALLLRMRANPLARGAGLCPADSHRAPQGDSGIPDQGRSARSWRTVDTIFCRRANGYPPASPGGLLSSVEAESRPEVTLADFDPDGEIKVVAAALYAVSDLPDDQLFGVARRMTPDDRAAVLQAYVGHRDEPPA